MTLCSFSCINCLSNNCRLHRKKKLCEMSCNIQMIIMHISSVIILKFDVNVSNFYFFHSFSITFSFIVKLLIFSFLIFVSYLYISSNNFALLFDLQEKIQTSFNSIKNNNNNLNPTTTNNKNTLNPKNNDQQKILNKKPAKKTLSVNAKREM